MSKDSSSGTTPESSSSGTEAGGFTYKSHGTNSNHYCARDYGADATNSNTYHYSNRDGSYYYSNPNGSTYYNNGQGTATYTRASGEKRTYKTDK
ncbi:hypothetical protein ISF_08380 [Cordyceps fumosorosea ARSEF 2679]|uniref:Uncharacterized protein n=1 Tax=Cordyceps fumosorosea (strain ARSEF 2679) TaxID=1081104 RepID=A0A167MK19_CORFA|nr:hypothetical protein ISF_08380 [Cordyceps fumosorosea ARSEF 2679]OAA54452.1 hypothetical protein ISF_08380 [Cordyceps fumosorosea ARSEF 2679]